MPRERLAVALQNSTTRSLPIAVGLKFVVPRGHQEIFHHRPVGQVDASLEDETELIWRE
jgi:hypothetical protein